MLITTAKVSMLVSPSVTALLQLLTKIDAVKNYFKQEIEMFWKVPAHLAHATDGVAIGYFWENTFIQDVH